MHEERKHGEGAMEGSSALGIQGGAHAPTRVVADALGGNLALITLGSCLRRGHQSPHARAHVLPENVAAVLYQNKFHFLSSTAVTHYQKFSCTGWCVWPICRAPRRLGGMVDALDSKSSSNECGFESHSRYFIVHRGSRGIS